MIAELGHYALVLALGLALVQASVPMLGARKNDPVLMGVGSPTAIAQFAFVAIAFVALIACYVRSDFSVINVFENSHSAKPLIYKSKTSQASSNIFFGAPSRSISRKGAIITG